MSDGKIDENIGPLSLAENGDKEDEVLENSVSDGEIVDDDEPEEPKTPTISFTQPKTAKNFRSRNEKSDSDSDGNSGNIKRISDAELTKLNSRITNGDQKLDKSTLESMRKKIIDELGRKGDRRQDRDLSRRNARLPPPNRARRAGFRGRNDGRIIRRQNQGMNQGARQERRAENKRSAGPDEVKIFGIKKPLYFPKNIIKHTKTTPSIQYSENPDLNRKKTKGADDKKENLKENKSNEKLKEEESKEAVNKSSEKTSNESPRKESSKKLSEKEKKVEVETEKESEEMKEEISKNQVESEEVKEKTEEIPEKVQSMVQSEEGKSLKEDTKTLELENEPKEKKNEPEELSDKFESDEKLEENLEAKLEVRDKLKTVDLKDRLNSVDRKDRIKSEEKKEERKDGFKSEERRNRLKLGDRRSRLKSAGSKEKLDSDERNHRRKSLDRKDNSRHERSRNRHRFDDHKNNTRLKPGDSKERLKPDHKPKRDRSRDKHKSEERRERLKSEERKIGNEKSEKLKSEEIKDKLKLKSEESKSKLKPDDIKPRRSDDSKRKSPSKPSSVEKRKPDINSRSKFGSETIKTKSFSEDRKNRFKTEINKLKLKLEDSKTQIKLEGDDKVKSKVEDKKVHEESVKNHEISPFKLQKSPERLKKAPEKASPEKPSRFSQKFKMELKIEKKKSPNRAERPKVNIFLEDSDEVDEFENVTNEVKSRWSSPEMVPKIVPAPGAELKRIIPEIPMVVESPERSPVAHVPLTESIFDASSLVMSKSPMSAPLRPAKVRNVCSFLSDIASGNIFSGLGLGSGLYDDGDNDLSSKISLNLKPKPLLDLKLPKPKVNGIIESVEPDTTGDKIVEKAAEKILTPSSDDSDSEDTDSDTSSSDSDSDDSSSEESSDESSDDDVPTFASGFGRFDASSMPMVTQIKPTSTPGPSATTTVTSRFQPQQSLIKPPGLVTNVTKPPLYTPVPVQPLPTVTAPFSIGLGALQFPFKIYSLRDIGSQMVYAAPAQPVVVTPAVDDKAQKEKEKKPSEKVSDKDKRERERKRSRSRSHSRERDKKRVKEDRRKTPPRKRSPSPPRKRSMSPVKKRHNDDRRTADERRPLDDRRAVDERRTAEDRRATDERKDARRRDPSPRHSSHSSRTSHGSRHSPIRRQRKSRSRSPPQRTPIARPRTPPRPKTPPLKSRRSSPIRRSLSRSPPSKYSRRSSSPGNRRNLSPSLAYRRSPRRRYSPSNNVNRNRRTPSPEFRHNRRSFSPTFRNKTDSPVGYKPDSTISDTELERQQQQQFMHDEFYASQWNNPMSTSPKRPNLDDRIHRILSDSPTHNAQANPSMYQADGYNYPMQHDNQSGMYYPDVYQQMPPPPSHHQMAHGPYDEFNNYSSPRGFVNNSNLVEITQQRRERQRSANSQAVQVGNVLEIVPSNKIVTPPETTPKDSFSKSKPHSPEQVKLTAEKRSQAKLKRKADRERKRLAKHVRKEKLRQEIQRYLDAGITADHSDDESLIPLRSVNVFATAEKGIMKKSRTEPKTSKKVLFRDGILPGESTSEDDATGENPDSQRRKRFRKKRLMNLVKSQTLNGPTASEDTLIDPELEKAPPPPPPADAPPAFLKQPQLKKITVEMFAAFPVNPDPIFYYIQKMQHANGFFHPHQVAPPPSRPDRFHYYKKQPPPNVGPPSGYIQQQQRGAIPKIPNPVSTLDPRLDPRINQQRTAEKSFA